MSLGILIDVNATKLIYGAAFVQYIVYTIFYLIKRDYNPPQHPNSNKSPNFSSDQENNTNKSPGEQFHHKPQLSIPDDVRAQKIGDNQDEQVQADDIDVDVPSQQEKPKQPQNMPSAPGYNNTGNDDDEDDQKPAGFQILDRFPRMLHFFLTACIISAMVSPTTFSVVIAWIANLFRGCQLIFALANKMKVALIFYIFAVMCTIFLYFNAMFHFV